VVVGLLVSWKHLVVFINTLPSLLLLLLLPSLLLLLLL